MLQKIMGFIFSFSPTFPMSSLTIKYWNKHLVLYWSSLPYIFHVKINNRVKFAFTNKIPIFIA